MKYARTFLQEVPQQATYLFIEYYAGRYIAKKKEEPEVQAQQQEGRLQSYLNASLLQQLPYMGGGGTTPNTPTHPPAGVSPKRISDLAGEATAMPLELPTQYKPPNPRTAFSSFVDHPNEFIVFLEEVLETAREGVLGKGDRVDIHTTLFEMYLQRAQEAKAKEEKQQWEAKAKDIIESQKVRFPLLHPRRWLIGIGKQDFGRHLQRPFTFASLGLPRWHCSCPREAGTAV